MRKKNSAARKESLDVGGGSRNGEISKGHAVQSWIDLCMLSPPFQGRAPLALISAFPDISSYAVTRFGVAVRWDGKGRERIRSRQDVSWCVGSRHC